MICPFKCAILSKYFIYPEKIKFHINAENVIEYIRKTIIPAIIESRTDNSVKNGRNLPVSNPKPDLNNINAYTKFGEKSAGIYKSYHPETKIWTCLEQITASKIDEVFAIANSNPTAQYQCTYQVW